MKREFLINIIFLLGINLLIKPLYLFGIDRTVQNILAPGVYGAFFAILNLSWLFQIIGDFGIQYYNNRQIAQHRHLLGKYFPSLIITKLLLALLFALLVFLTGGVMGYWKEYPLLLALVILNQILLSFLLFLRSNVSGLGFYRLDSILSVLDKLSMILLLGLFLWTPKGQALITIERFALAQTISFLLPILIALWIIRPHFTKSRWRFNPRLLLVILKQSYPYALVVLLMTLYTRLDAVMVDNLLEDGHEEADLYASAYRLLDAANVFGYLFAGLLLPMFARLLKEKQSVGSLAKFGIQMIWSGSIPLAFALMAFSTPVMEALYVDGSAYSGRILAWLILSFVAMSGTYIYGTLLTANGSLMKMNRIFIIGIFLNVGLNLILIPSWKSEGAALATCITQFFVFLAQLILAQKELLPGINWPLIGRILLFCSAVALLTWTIQRIDFSISWYYLLAVNVLLGILLAFVMKMLDFKLLLSLLKER